MPNKLNPFTAPDPGSANEFYSAIQPERGTFDNLIDTINHTRGMVGGLLGTVVSIPLKAVEITANTMGNILTLGGYSHSVARMSEGFSNRIHDVLTGNQGPPLAKGV